MKEIRKKGGLETMGGMSNLIFLIVIFNVSITIAAESKNYTSILKGGVKHHQTEYEAAQKLNLAQIETYKQAEQLVKKKKLVKVYDTSSYIIDKSLGQYAKSKAEKKYLKLLLPHTKAVLASIANNFHTKFRKKRLRITSLLRPIEYSDILAKYNGNVSPTSTHPFGCTFDISHDDLKHTQKQYLRYILAAKEQKGEIYATEENHQSCFHVMDRHLIKKDKLMKKKIKHKKKVKQIQKVKQKRIKMR